MWFRLNICTKDRLHIPFSKKRFIFIFLILGGLVFFIHPADTRQSVGNSS